MQLKWLHPSARYTTPARTDATAFFSVQRLHGFARSFNTLYIVEVPFWPPCFYWFFGSCFGGHDEAGLLAFEALQGLPRPARGTHGRSYCGRNRLWGRQHVAGTTLYDPLWEPRMWQGQVWEARPDGESTRGKAKFGKRHGSRKWEEENSSTRRRHRGKGRKRQQTPSPPIQCATHPIGHPQGGLLSITSQTPEMHPRPFFGGFWHPQWSFARVFPHPQGNPQASARALADMWIKMAAFPDLALRRCCLAEIARACNYSSWFKFSSSQSPLETYKLRNMVRFRAILCLEVPIQCQRLQFYTRPWCQRFYRDFMAPLPCENTSAAWQLFFTARTGAKPHRLDSSVTLLLRRVVQSKTQWHSNVLKLLKLLQKSSQALKTFFQLLQIKRLQLKLTNTLQNSYPIQSQHHVPRTWVKQHPKTPQTTKTNENPSLRSSMHKLIPFGSKLVPTWFL